VPAGCRHQTLVIVNCAGRTPASSAPSPCATPACRTVPRRKRHGLGLAGLELARAAGSRCRLPSARFAASPRRCRPGRRRFAIPPVDYCWAGPPRHAEPTATLYPFDVLTRGIRERPLPGARGAVRARCQRPTPTLATSTPASCWSTLGRAPGDDRSWLAQMGCPRSTCCRRIAAGTKAGDIRPGHPNWEHAVAAGGSPPSCSADSIARATVVDSGAEPRH